LLLWQRRSARARLRGLLSNSSVASRQNKKRAANQREVTNQH